MNKRTLILFGGLAVLCLVAVMALFWKDDTTAGVGSTTTADMVIPMSSTVAPVEPRAGNLPYITHEKTLAVPVESIGFLVTEGGIITVGHEADGKHYALFQNGQPWVGLDIATADFSIVQVGESQGWIYVLSTDHENALYLDILVEDGQAVTSAQFVDASRTFPEAEEDVYRMVIHGQTLYILSMAWEERVTCQLRSFDLASMALQVDPYPNIVDYNFQRGFTADTQGNLYFCSTGELLTNIYKLTPSTGDFESFLLPSAPFPLDLVCYEDRLYMLTKEGVSVYSLAGGPIEQLFLFVEDVPLLPFGLPLGYCQWLAMLSPDTLYLPFLSGTADAMHAQFIKITRQWVDALPPKPEKTQLVFTMAYPERSLLEAIRLYEIMVPDIDIVVDAVAVDAETANWNAETVSLTLATKLLTGQAGDLYSMGGEGLQYYDLLKTDAFVDLTERLEPLKDTLYPHMLEGIRVNGVIRALPVGMDPRYFRYNVDWGQALGYEFDPYQLTASTLIDMAATMQVQGDTRSPVGYSYEYFFNELVLANLYDLLNPETGSFDLRQPWFIKLVEDFKGIYIPAVEGEKQTEYLFDLRMQMTEYYGLELWLRNDPLNTRLVPNMKSEVSGYRATRSFFLYAIPSSSERQEEAWAFLEFLSSQAGQESYFDTARSNIAADERELSYLTPETRADITAINSSVTHLHSIYQAEFDIIVPLREYLLGNTTLDAALSQAEYNLTLRFSE